MLGLLMVAGAPAIAASPWQKLADPVFVHADTRELPEAAVMTVAQDSTGFLWVGTQGGLARFDGYHFRSFLPNAGDPKALPDGYIRALLADVRGGVWIGSSSDGLVHFDAATETFHTWRRDSAGRTGPRSAAVDALADAADGGLWVGGDGGLGHFDRKAGTFVPEALTRGAQPNVWSVLVDRAGTVWAGTQNGLFERPAGARAFRPFALRDSAAGVAPAIYGLAEDHNGNLWAGSVSTVYAIDAKRAVTRALRSSPDAARVAPGQQWSIAEMQPGMMWAGTDDAISIIDEATFAVHRVEIDQKNPGGLTVGRVLQFLRDRSGMVWLADHVGGLLLFDPFSHGLFELSGSRPEFDFGNEGMPALAASGSGVLWAGGFNGRLAEFRPPSVHPAVSFLPNHAAVQTLFPGSGGRLWIGSTHGLCRLDAGAAQPVCPTQPAALAEPSVYAILEYGGRLWVGGSTGLWVEDLAGGNVAPLPSRGAEGLSNTQVRALYRDHRNRLWVGTENGLNRIDPNGRIVRFVFAAGNPNSIGPGGVTTIIEDRHGRIWAGAAGGPMDVLQEDRDGTTRVHRIGTAEGLPHENVDGLAEDAHGTIWASTDRGLALIDPDALRARAFGLADGVSEGAFWAASVSRSTDGTIFFGGLEGVTIVAPGAASPWVYAPPLVVSRLQLGRRTVSAWSVNQADGTVELPADDRDINVEFSSLDYSAPRALRYEYKLDGYDRDWIEVDAQHRTANYSHLVPGDYTFEVRGTNRLGVWSRHVFRLGVHALPAWYETRWFRLLALVVLILAAYGAHRLRTAVLRQRQRELEAIVERRTRELSEANVKLQELSLSDPLTGLRNRRFLTQHLENGYRADGAALRRLANQRDRRSAGRRGRALFPRRSRSLQGRERPLRTSCGRYAARADARAAARGVPRIGFRRALGRR